MSVSVPNGSIVSIANGYGPITAITALTNAAAAVATLAAGSGIAAGDAFEVVSGWSRLTDKVVRALAVASNDVTLEGYNTLSTAIYPNGSGVPGTVRKISGFTQLSQITASNTTGGDQNFLEYQFLESDQQKRIPTFKSPVGISFTVADDPTLAGYVLAKQANDDRLQRAVKLTFPSGGALFFNAFISLRATPTLTINQLMEIEVTMSLLNETVRYAT